MKISVTKDLSALRIDAKKRIDARAEERRVLPDRITPGHGQMLEYRDTLDEARALQDDPTPVDADYTMLAVERDAQIDSGANASATLTSVATEVLAQHADWVVLGGRIKELRRLGKMRIDQATTPAAIEHQVSTTLTDLDTI